MACNDCNDLYRTVGDIPLLKCVSEEDEEYILQEMHEGIFGAHIEVGELV